MRILNILVLLAVAMCAAYLLYPSQSAMAGSLHWQPVEGGPTQSTNGGYYISAELVDGNGDVQGTVTTGTTDSKRAARRASRKLAESLNEGGSAFKWDPACEGANFDC